MPTEIASQIHGRTIHPYDLLAEITDRHSLDDRTAHDAIHGYLDQLIQDDGEDAIILGRRPIKPELLEHNPLDRDIYWWLTITDEAAETIRTSIDYEHPELWTIPRIAKEMGVAESSARGQIARWKKSRGLAPHEFQPHPDSARPQALYSAREVREALTSRPGKGRWGDREQAS
jgi:hypothetical protein